MRKISLFFLLLISLQSIAQERYLFAGTYTNGKSKGIYIYKFNSDSGTLKLVSVTENVENPSYLAFHPNKKNVYSVNENGGSKPGEVSSFVFDEATGNLRFLNKQPSGGDHPCYISVDKTGKYLLVGNYSGGTLSALPIKADGSLQPFSQSVKHEGQGVNKQRQEKAHVHSTVLSPDQHFLMVPDLGIDKVVVYAFDANKQEPFIGKTDLSVSVDPGSGPRHITFHPSLPYAYLVEELSGTVRSFGYTDGKLTEIQTISSHPADFKGQKGSADIHISPDGRFLYASNRGDANSIAVYSIDRASGKLSLSGIQSAMGIHPRNFMIDPTGKYLLVANRDSNHIVIFKRNMQTGLLTPNGTPVEVPAPVFLGMR